MANRKHGDTFSAWLVLPTLGHKGHMDTNLLEDLTRAVAWGLGAFTDSIRNGGLGSIQAFFLI